MIRKYTKQELDEMRQLKSQGATYEEIARMFNRSAMAVQVKFSAMGWGEPRAKKDTVPTVTVAPTTAPTAPATAKKPSLADFQPREMIKYLYNLGYRIENNKLVYVHRQVIDIRKIMED